MIRYFSSKAAVATITKGRLRVSEASKFNDPFEFALLWPRENGEDLPHDFLRRFIDERVRVLCTCDPSRLDSDGDILMWSHYGDGHAGCRVHIDREFLEEHSTVHWDVEYAQRVPIIDTDYVEFLDEGVRDVEAFENLSLSLRAKGLFWSYERERRYFFEKWRCRYDRKGGYHYLSLKPNSLTRIDFGLQTSEELIGRIKKAIVASPFKCIKLFKASRPHGSFSIEYIRC